MNKQLVTVCPECFAPIEPIDDATHPYLPAPAGCWSKFNAVLAKEFSDAAYFKAHRLTVDAYCAQHASGTDRRQIQSVAIHLVALYLSFEKHCSDEQITGTMDALIKHYKNRFPVLNRPSFEGTLNVTSLLGATCAEEHHALRLNWARSVWNTWQAEHQTIADLVAADRALD